MSIAQAVATGKSSGVVNTTISTNYKYILIFRKNNKIKKLYILILIMKKLFISKITYFNE